MGPRGSKIDYDGTIRTVFDLKITFPTCVRVKNITFDQFLKIFANYRKFSKIYRKTYFFKIVQKSF